ncbi:MAG: hypothetical protein J0L80_02360 [Chitinophagales bacterium]|nr:hypothetical protein [Chitinophagales bacterium]
MSDMITNPGDIIFVSVSKDNNGNQVCYIDPELNKNTDPSFWGKAQNYWHELTEYARTHDLGSEKLNMFTGYYAYNINERHDHLANELAIQHPELSHEQIEHITFADALAKFGMGELAKEAYGEANTSASSLNATYDGIVGVVTEPLSEATADGVRNYYLSYVLDQLTPKEHQMQENVAPDTNDNLLPQPNPIMDVIHKITDELTPPNYGPMVMNEGNDYVEPSNPLQVASETQASSVNLGADPGVIIDPADGVTTIPASNQASDDIGSTYVRVEPVSNETVIPSDTIFPSPESVFHGEQQPVTTPQDEPVIVAQNDIYTEQPVVTANDVYAPQPVVEDNTSATNAEQPGIPVADIFATTPTIGSDNGNWGIQPSDEHLSVPVADIFANTPTIGSGGDNWSQPVEQPSIPVQDMFANTPYIETGNIQTSEPTPEVQSVFHVDTVTPSNEIAATPLDNSWVESASNTSPTDSWTNSVSDNSQTHSSSDNNLSI